MLKKRPVAAVIAAAVILLSVPFGAVRSYNKAAAAIEGQFYDGVYLKDEDYAQPAIQSHLDARADAALGLITAANGDAALSGPAQALHAARHALLAAGTLGEKYDANARLEDAWRQLYDGLTQGQAPTAQIDTYAQRLSGAQAAIGQSRYNETVGSFYKGRDVMTRLLALFLPFDDPGYFNQGGLA